MRLNPTDDVEIAALYVEGSILQEIASRFSTSITSVTNSLKRTQTSRRRPGPRGLRKRYVLKKPRRQTPFFELYRWWDNDTFTLLYVGHAFASIARAQSHSQVSEWYWKYRNKSMTIQAFDTFEQMLEVERKAIAEEKPLFNIMGTK
jgi:hypothetical protein